MSLTTQCPRCEAMVAAQQEGDFRRRLETTTPQDPDTEQVALFSCPKCSHAFLASRHGYDDGFTDTTSWDEWDLIYPAEPRLGASVPEPMAKGYLEARRCFGAGAPTAAAIMCRRTLETLCKGKGASGRNLAAMLKDLQTKGVIAAQLFEWADELRLVGNDAAHNVEEFVSKEDARDGIEFTRAIIEYVYTFTDAFERFKRRRATKATTTAG